MAMTDSDKTSTRGRTRDYSEYDLTGGRTRRAEAPQEKREWRSTANMPTGMMKDITPRWIKPENLSGETFGRLMANYPDRAGVPMLTQPLQKMTKELQKNKRDLRMPGNGVTESIDFEFLGHPDWKRRGY